MSKHFEDYETGEASRRRLTDAEKAEIAEIVPTKWEEQAPGAFIRATVGKETNASGMVRVRIAVMPELDVVARAALYAQPNKKE